MLAAAALGWLANYVFVADRSDAALLSLPVWLAVGAAVGWLAVRWWAQRRSEQRLSSIEDGASDAILRVDGEGVIRGWSRGAEELYGYSSDEAVGRPLAELLPVPTDDHLDDIVNQRRSDGSSFRGAVRVMPLDGETLILVHDVTEPQRLTGELRATEAKYRSLTEHLPVTTYVRSLNGQGELDFVSPQIERLLGYTPDEWIADPGLFLRLVHPDDRDAVAQAHDAADETTQIGLDYRMLARDGRVVWMRERAVAVLDEAGKPLCLQGYLLDVGERHAAEEERKQLRAAEVAALGEGQDRQSKLELVAQAATVLASSLDARATVEQVAALTVRDLAQWCVVDVRGEDGSVERLAAAHAEPMPVSAGPTAYAEPAVPEAIPEREPTVDASGIRVPLLSRGRRSIGVLTLVNSDEAGPYVADDLSWARALAAMIALAIEKSRLHVEVEARADANRVLRYVGDGVFFVDRAGVIRLWNPAAAATTGVPADVAVGKPAAEAIPDWHELGERAPVGTASDPARAATLPLETTRGERWISISGVQFFGGTVYAFRDITEEHRLEELKADFIATASHELRTPLAAVYGAAQTLRRHDFALDDSGRERFISMIVDESDRLAGIVNQILLANQLEVGRLDLVTEPFDAADMIERVVESARTHAPPHITFEIHVADGVPPVAADKDRARQVLVNLVENAVKYSPGGGKVVLGAEADDGAVRFRVADEGLGIPADEQALIFQKFYRLDPNMTQGIGGTGLGLYICSELVERMGGDIWLESEERAGSTFFFRLPSATPSRPWEVAERERAGSAAPGRGAHRR